MLPTVSHPPTLVPFCTCGKCGVLPITPTTETAGLVYDYTTAASTPCMNTLFPGVPTLHRTLLIRMFADKETNPPPYWKPRTQLPSWFTFTQELRRCGLRIKAYLEEEMQNGDRKEEIRVVVRLDTAHQKQQLLINTSLHGAVRSPNADIAARYLMLTVVNDVLEVVEAGHKSYLIFNLETNSFERFQEGSLTEHFPLGLFTRAYNIIFKQGKEVPLFNWRAVFAE